MNSPKGRPAVFTLSGVAASYCTTRETPQEMGGWWQLLRAQAADELLIHAGAVVLNLPNTEIL